MPRKLIIWDETEPAFARIRHRSHRHPQQESDIRSRASLRTADEGRKRQRFLLCGHHHAGFRRRRATLGRSTLLLENSLEIQRIIVWVRETYETDFHPRHAWPAMEGRTNVRPDPNVRRVQHRCSAPSMEGRTIVRPDQRTPQQITVFADPSMEGRTIARPVRTLYDPPDNYPVPSMEGRTIVRPVHRQQVPNDRRLHPSMEGRTIVRPVLVCSATTISYLTAFNGGPDNRPASRDAAAPNRTPSRSLQWRAGQSSGQSANPRG